MTQLCRSNWVATSVRSLKTVPRIPKRRRSLFISSQIGPKVEIPISSYWFSNQIIVSNRQANFSPNFALRSLRKRNSDQLEVILISESSLPEEEIEIKIAKLKSRLPERNKLLIVYFCGLSESKQISTRKHEKFGITFAALLAFSEILKYFWCCYICYFVICSMFC